ncbi:NAD(P)H-binding protein [Glycomyces tenuis]|uniref:NAD(P)H-binding protein n=1 Tax=Glycomyces tenuis TaxID=58116 RepID=UPI00042311B6|nr:NAD(P)H-binding protein [Glycomyces tenuis]
MIVVTGATGNIGRPLVEALCAAGESVTALSRSHHESTAAVTWVRADPADPASLKPAFDGADKLFLMAPGPQFDLTAIVDAAKTAGIEKAVLVSSQRVGSRPEEGLEPMERPVTESGLEWTVLRPGGFASNALLWAESVRASRSITAPFGDVGLPVIDPADIAAVAAAALLGDGHAGLTYTLTGPALVTPRDQAKAIGEALGEPVRFIEQTEHEAFEALTRFWPAEVVEGTLQVLGEPNDAERTISPDVETVTGRRPNAFTGWAHRNVAAFR